MKVLFLNPQQEMGGIQCLSAFLKQGGYQTALVNDPNLFENPWVQFSKLGAWMEDKQHVMDQIAAHSPDLVALSVVTDDFKWGLKWADRIKNELGIPIVMGNAHPTFHPELVLGKSSVDFIARGEGELTLLELTEALEGRRDFSSVQGLGYKTRGGALKINEMRPLIENMDILPYPDKDLYYEAMPYLDHGYTTMSGRGCPYRCTFCDNNSSQRLYRASGRVQKWTRRHSPEYVVKEILWAKERYGIKHVRFNDEDFSYSKEWTREFCALYKEAKIGIPWFAWVYPNTVDKEIAELMADAGCDAVEMGIQSGSEHLRKEVLHRNTKDEQIKKSMLALREAKIRTTVDIIVGLPTESKEDLDSTVRLLRDGNPWHLYAFWLRYYPSTEILQMAKERKLLSPEHIKQLEDGLHSRGHIAGGTELEKDGLSRSYHAFIVLLPLMPRWLVDFFLRHDLIQHFPSFLNPFLLVNISKMIKRDKYNEFRVRGWHMLAWECTALVYRMPRRFLRWLSGRPPTPLTPQQSGNTQ